MAKYPEIMDGNQLRSDQLRNIGDYLDRLREMDNGDLCRQYGDLFGHPPPRTTCREWLFYNCAYKFQEKHYFKEKVSDDVVKRQESWYHKLTPEMHKEVELGKLKVAELKPLCKEFNVTWDANKRKEIVRQLALAICGGEYLKLDVVTVVKGTTTKPKRGRVARPDNLPGNIEDLLKLKAGADKETQRLIRRKLRAIDPDWKQKYG